MSEPEKTWTISALVKWATEDFRTRGLDSPRLDAELIVSHALGISRTDVIIQGDRPLETRELQALRELVKRRRAREPMAYLRGFREFYGRSFKVDARVLIPRPETEVLVDVALRRIRPRSLSARVLDLCTGSGCVAITLARELPTASVVGTDISAGALAVARENAYRLGAYRASFREGDLCAAAVPGAVFDLVTANPPYIASREVGTLMADVKDFEPRLALDGGDDGLDFYRRIARDVPTRMAPGATLVLEVGYDEAADVEALLCSRGFSDIQVDKDMQGVARIVSAVAPSQPL